MASKTPTIGVEVVYAEPQRACVTALRMPLDSRVGDALRLAAANPAFGALDLDSAAVGIFGKPVRREQRLKEGDRIEIYRPLAVDPKTARRARSVRAAKLAKTLASKSGRS